MNYKGTEILADSYSHISLKDLELCLDCEQKPCTFICPSNVYWWREDTKMLEIRYQQCLECGASLLICPRDNIQWVYPRGGYGIDHKF